MQSTFIYLNKFFMIKIVQLEHNKKICKKLTLSLNEIGLVMLVVYFLSDVNFISIFNAIFVLQLLNG